MTKRSDSLYTKHGMFTIIIVMMFFLIVTPAAAEGVLADWTEATASAAFPGRYDHASTVYDGKIWVVGGLNVASGYSTFNDVWYSTDGAKWIQATGSAAFPARSSQSSVVYDGKMWVVGGLNVAATLNDVWYSTNGATWAQATGSAGFAARSGHTSMAYDGKMWVVGGLNVAATLNDVWYSTDGATWIQATGSAAFSPRSSHSSVVYDGKMWVIGGFDGNDLNDVWYSTNGATWAQATGSAAFPPRHGHTSVVYDGKMWVIGGGSGYNDVWYSTDGANWTQATDSAAFPARTFHTSVVYNGLVWVIGGNISPDDVWYSGGGDTSSTVIIGNGSISGPGNSTTITLTLDNAPRGLGGYNLKVTIENSSVAKITGVSFPGWATGMNTHGTLPATRDLLVKASDTGYEVESGASNVTLATLTLEGLYPGSTAITIQDTNFYDDKGEDIQPSVITGTLTVDYMPALVNITPSSGYHNDSVNVTLAGTWLNTGAVVYLARPASVIPAANLSYVSDTQIDCVFNLTRQDEGKWNVTVTNPDGKTATLTDGFTIVRQLIPVDEMMPIDPDEDGKYEDMNSNGQADYVDVNIFFVSYTWIEENEPVDAFDFNNNGALDLADIVTIFDSIS
jgi:hypothetical protein